MRGGGFEYGHWWIKFGKQENQENVLKPLDLLLINFVLDDIRGNSPALFFISVGNLVYRDSIAIKYNIPMFQLAVLQTYGWLLILMRY